MEIIFQQYKVEVFLVSYQFHFSVDKRKAIKKSLKMFFNKVFVVLAFFSFKCSESFSLQQLQDGQLYARDCIIKVQINPMAVSQLAKGNLTRNDEKLQVS